MRALTWLLRAFLFFTLFAFALNNQGDVTVHWFFGRYWRAPMIYVVLAAFMLGCSVGVLALLPSWWRHRRRAQDLAATLPPSSPAGSRMASPAPGPGTPAGAAPSGFEEPPRPDLPAPRSHAPQTEHGTPDGS